MGRKFLKLPINSVAGANKMHPVESSFPRRFPQEISLISQLRVLRVLAATLCADILLLSQYRGIISTVFTFPARTFY